MNKTMIKITLSCCLILGASLAHADTDLAVGRMQDKVIFRAMDTDLDERVTRDEFKDYAMRKFQELDLDSSGALNSNEMQQGYKMMIDKIRNEDATLSSKR